MSLLMANRALIKTSASTPVYPIVIEDGNSVGWYIADDLTTITKDASDFMSEWDDKLGSGRDLLQALGSNQPKWVLNDGVLNDGIDNFMKTLAFTFNQPEQIYIVYRLITWVVTEYIFDGNTTHTGMLYTRTASPILTAYAGNISGGNGVVLNDFLITRIRFDGANSIYQHNDLLRLTGNYGSNNMGGFTLGARGDGGAGFVHSQVKEVLLRKVADSASDEQDIYDYLAAKYSI